VYKRTPFSSDNSSYQLVSLDEALIYQLIVWEIVSPLPSKILFTKSLDDCGVQNSTWTIHEWHFTMGIVRRDDGGGSDTGINQVIMRSTVVDWRRRSRWLRVGSGESEARLGVHGQKRQGNKEIVHGVICFGDLWFVS